MYNHFIHNIVHNTNIYKHAHIEASLADDGHAVPGIIRYPILIATFSKTEKKANK